MSNLPLPIGPVMIDIAGLALTDHEIDLIAHPNTGAVILFARNFQSQKQVAELITAIRAARNGDVLIAVDQEGGRVQRFQNGFTRLPPASAYAKTPELTEPAGWLMASELLAVGVDFSFAPVLDIDYGVSEIIGNRAFADSVEQVTQLSSAFRRGMKKAGMSATGKHFPGHGAVALDSHLTLPVDERDWETVWTQDIAPFRHLINDGLEAIMPAHVLYPQINDKPAGFSYFWLQQILRQALGFNGVIFSDDLSMEGAAIAGNYPERAQLAMQAGCDMVLVCNNPTAAEQVLEALPVKADQIREQRLKAMQGQGRLGLDYLQASEQWQTVSSLIQALANQYA